MKKANDVVGEERVRSANHLTLLREPIITRPSSCRNIQSPPFPPSSKTTSAQKERERERKRERDMHLWPSATIRDSFKLDYLRKLDWNLQRMKSAKESQKSVKQNLLDGKDGGAAKQLDSPRGQVNGKAADLTNPKAHGRDRIFAGLCGETLMLLSCCFCCGACADEEADLIF
ncbi:hypothetical protein D8674_000988 [Pyrus ussuriensis x Pyrus communis]|uniref:Uncharacterized protein n=1 Tax=Pyrus ussuriensis x Pyrus communis TaxID=2448454 RepID=A0A5N5F4S3_9ROSA|nr:uncharacterized protein LOC103936637 [Pyrus x bretschneideri]KAB2598068.1 hypothetical protein D8674_000988 [Pyrus ussuriensis x Pyrus communis]